MKVRMACCFILLLILLAFVDARHKADSLLMKAVSISESCSKSSSKATASSSYSELLKVVGMLTTEICQILPAALEAKCLETSQTYVCQTELLFEQLFYEESLCNRTGYCRNKSRLLTDKSLDREIRIPLEMLEVKTCVACRRTVKDLVKKAKQPKMKHKIIEALVDFCKEVDGDEDRCKEVIPKYGPRVLTALEKIKPSDLCRLMGMCGKDTSM